ncbi:MAG: hypothetical protein KIT68_08885 [Phycisphaeraceae bacterium]|nr:hypothetical protein [Phycisphaeraceae bacterium]
MNGRTGGRGGGRGRCAFTLVELITVVVVSLLLSGFLLVVVSDTVRRGHCCHSPALRNATQIRSIVQAMQMWGEANRDQFPLPSALDASDATVSAGGDPERKNTTANIASILIWEELVPVEWMVAHGELHPNIAVDDDYQAARPVRAADPDAALWDPAFNDDFTTPAGAIGRVSPPGNLSFAFMPPVGERRALWKNTFDPTRALVGERGPELARVVADAAGNAVYRPVRSAPATLVSMRSGSWAGSVGYADGHVNFETSYSPPELVYNDGRGRLRLDCLFVDEPDDAGRRNQFLGIFPTAGRSVGQPRFIWD